jgi:hypothetical protein
LREFRGQNPRQISIDLPGRRLNPATLDRETALQQAKAVARAAQGSE